MYRIRADAVSGTKVYAGGKWLQCIGNKRVNVGDFIYTDGRCVYGNNQLSQQPLVITRQTQEEGIPIILFKGEYIPQYVESYGYYSFEKNQLKLVENVSPTPKHKFMINDAKGNVFVYDEAPITVGENLYERILAANIDKFGNRFYIVGQYKNYVFGQPEPETGYIRIKILKNGTVTQEINLNNVRQQFESLLPSSSMFDNPLKPEIINGIDTGISISNAFIENENLWFCLLELNTSIGFLHQSSIEFPSEPEMEAHYITVWIYFTSTEKYILRQDSNGVYYLWEDINLYSHFEHPEINNAKIYLQDGYYYTMRPNPDSIGDNGYTYSYLKDFFNPNGEKIFTYSAELESRSLIAKINGGYLLGTDDTNSYFHATNYFPDILSAKDGIFSYKNHKWTQLAEGKCINQRLRPMTKYKNWQDRVQELTLAE